MIRQVLPYVLTLTGPSQSGKSLVIKLLDVISRHDDYSGFQPCVIKKYTTREFRKDEIDKIKLGDADKLDVKPVIGRWNEVEDDKKDTVNKSRLSAFNKKQCDLAYEQYGNRYGIKISEIYDSLSNGKTPIVILNDIRTVEDLKTLLGDQCYSIFIFREVPNLANYLTEGMKRNENEYEIKRRFEKAESIYRIYIENIYIFDNLILNIKNGDESLKNILRQILSYLCAKEKFFN